MDIIVNCSTNEVRYAEPKLPPLADRKSALLDRLASIRFERETGGIVVNGAPVATDRQSVGILTAAYVRAKGDPSFVILNWKVGKASFITLDAAAIEVVAEAVTAHVQACFDRERLLTDAILSAKSHAALNAIDIETGW